MRLDRVRWRVARTFDVLLTIRIFMMNITSDWHIHTPASCDCRHGGLPVDVLAASAAAWGLTACGVSDHIHTPYTRPDLERSRQAFLACDPPSFLHFGCEASCISQWELDRWRSGAPAGQEYGLRTGGPEGGAPAIGLTTEDVENLGIEYVIGGCHWPLYVPFEREAIIRDYHRQYLFLATHPLVDIVAHPWWWMGHWKDADGGYRGDPWLDDFGKIPRSMHDELAAAVKQHGTAIEINLNGILLNPGYPPGFAAQYVEYLAGLRSQGVRFALGSDTHSTVYGDRLVQGDGVARVERMLDEIGLCEEDLWRLPPRPVHATGG